MFFLLNIQKTGFEIAFDNVITPFSLKNGTLFDLYNKKYLLL